MLQNNATCRQKQETLSQNLLKRQNMENRKKWFLGAFLQAYLNFLWKYSPTSQWRHSLGQILKIAIERFYCAIIWTEKIKIIVNLFSRRTRTCLKGSQKSAFLFFIFVLKFISNMLNHTVVFYWTKLAKKIHI